MLSRRRQSMCRCLWLVQLLLCRPTEFYPPGKMVLSTKPRRLNTDRKLKVARLKFNFLIILKLLREELKNSPKLE